MKGLSVNARKQRAINRKYARGAYVHNFSEEEINEIERKECTNEYVIESNCSKFTGYSFA